jgi:hypothetical protein
VKWKEERKELREISKILERDMVLKNDYDLYLKLFLTGCMPAEDEIISRLTQLLTTLPVLTTPPMRGESMTYWVKDKKNRSVRGEVNIHESAVHNEDVLVYNSFWQCQDENVYRWIIRYGYYCAIVGIHVKHEVFVGHQPLPTFPPGLVVDEILNMT